MRALPSANEETLAGSDNCVPDEYEAPAPYADYIRTQPSVRTPYWRPAVLCAWPLQRSGLRRDHHRGDQPRHLEIEAFDEDVQVSILQGGKEVNILDSKTGNKVTLRAGEYQLKLPSDRTDVQLSRDTFTMTRGGKVIVKVTRLPPKAVRTSWEIPPDQWVELLPALDVHEDQILGDWRMDEEGLTHAWATVSNIAFPVIVDGSYELQVDFTAARNTAPRIQFPIGESHHLRFRRG